MVQHGWDRGFAQQALADAYNAEFATAETKPITLAFALVGLYLKVERGCDGRQVQFAHRQLTRRSCRFLR